MRKLIAVPAAVALILTSLISVPSWHAQAGPPYEFDVSVLPGSLPDGPPFVFSLTVTPDTASQFQLSGTGYIVFDGLSAATGGRITHFSFEVTGVGISDTFTLDDVNLSLGDAGSTINDNFVLSPAGDAIQHLSLQTNLIPGAPVLTLGPTSANYETVWGAGDLHRGDMEAERSVLSGTGRIAFDGLSAQSGGRITEFSFDVTGVGISDSFDLADVNFGLTDAGSTINDNFVLGPSGNTIDYLSLQTLPVIGESVLTLSASNANYTPQLGSGGEVLHWGTLTAAPPGGMPEILVPAYANPCCADGPAMWNSLIGAAQLNVPLHVVFNPASGPGAGPEIDPNFVNADPAIGDPLLDLYLAGAKIYGYVATGFGDRNLADVMNDIDLYYDPAYFLNTGIEVRGIFLDEMSNDLADVGFYQSIRQHILSHDANALIFGNPGTPFVNDSSSGNSGFDVEDYAAAVDTIFTFENTSEEYQTNYIPPWMTPAGPVAPNPALTSFGHIVHTTPTLESMYRNIELSRERDVDFLYVTDDVLANPFDRLQGNWHSFVYGVLGNRLDQDDDGILDAIDTQPAVVSSDFDDAALGGATNGSLLTRGEQTLLSIQDSTLPAPGTGIVVTTSTDPGPDALPAEIQACQGASQSLVEIFAGSEISITCGSITVGVTDGTASLTFTVGDQTATATLSTGNAVSFDPISGEVSALASNTDPVVVTIDDQEILLPPGSTETADVTPPVVTAAIVPLEISDEREGKFRIEYQCTDAIDPNPVVKARLNGKKVRDGQIIEVDDDDRRRKLKLRVRCKDASGNVSKAKTVFKFPKKKKHRKRDDDDHDDD